MSNQPTVRDQLTRMSKELAVWLGPVLLIWLIAVPAFTLFATPWQAGLGNLRIGFGVVVGSTLAGIFAWGRLHKLADKRVGDADE